MNVCAMASLTGYAGDRFAAWYSQGHRRGSSRLKSARLFKACFNSRPQIARHRTLSRLSVNVRAGEGGDLTASNADGDSRRFLPPKNSQLNDEISDKFSLNDVIAEQLEEVEKAARSKREEQAWLEDCVVYAEERAGDKRYLEVVVTSIHQVDHGKYISPSCHGQR